MAPDNVSSVLSTNQRVASNTTRISTGSTEAARRAGTYAAKACLFVAPTSSAELERFVGTWVAKYQGTTFFTLQLKLTNSSLGGICVHNDRMAWVDGELIPTGSEFSTEKILEASSSGKKLLLKIGSENSTDGFPLEFTLTAPGQAEARITAPSESGAPPQGKPWHFERIGQ